jgi:HlyD family secretion protein
VRVSSSPTHPPTKNNDTATIGLARPIDFAPGLLRIQERPPEPFAGLLLKVLLVLVAALVAWAALARLDIVAVAPGKLVPQTYLKIVQPPEQGIVREILVRDGQEVSQGQVLIRMDAVIAGADLQALSQEHEEKRLALRRIAAQLDNAPLRRQDADSPDVFARVAAQYQANVQAYHNTLAQERSTVDKARADLAAAQQVKAKIEETLPHYRTQDEAYSQLVKEGFMGKIIASDKKRERQEREQDFLTQEHNIRSLQAVISQSERKIAQITAEYRRQLQQERVEAAAQLEKLAQELTKHQHRNALLELKAPHAGVIKDLATHTAGTVAAPGTILMTVVPKNEPLMAEVYVTNEDVGFVRAGQDVRLKLAAFQFNKYGLLEGRVRQVSADASEAREGAAAATDTPRSAAVPLTYRTIVDLGSQQLVSDGKRHELTPGMQVTAEIHLGTRTVLEYLFSPLTRAFHDAARER